MNEDDSARDSSDSEVAGNSGRDSVPVRPEGRLDSQGDSGTPSAAEAERKPERDPLEGIDIDQLRRDPILLAQITASLQENHLHLPILTPDRKEMAAMRAETPELYDLYIDGL